MRPRAGAAVALLAVSALTSFAPVGRAAARPSVRPIPAVVGQLLSRHNLPVAPTDAACRDLYDLDCYSPLQLRTAYDVPVLSAHGRSGAGRTIAIVDAFGSPTLQTDLAVFDATYGLPDPPSVRTITPAGAVPAFDPTDGDMVGWALETTLDVEYAHAIAPDAAILVVATPVSETEGVQGFPEIVAAERYVIDHGLADVISQSFGATEDTFPDPATLLSLRGAVLDAAAHDVTMLAAAGDTGATGYEIDAQTLYDHPVVTWPASDPLVTAVGGTRLSLDADGRRTAPDAAWHDAAGAGGGGRSDVFARPRYQNGVSAVVGASRGTPDVALSSALDGGVLVYSSFDPSDVGWGIVGGTSAATPLFAGVVAIADQVGHARLGVLGPALYAMGRAGAAAGLIDVTSGATDFGGVPGFVAGKGYDLSTGLGTVDVARFAPMLALVARPLSDATSGVATRLV